MKILVTTIVDPQFSAYSRLHQFVGHLSKNHAIDMISVRDSWKERQPSSTSHADEYKAGRYSGSLDYLTESARGISYQELFSAPVLRKTLDSRLGMYDLILDYNTILTGNRSARLLPGVPRIYDLADDIGDMVRNSPHMPSALSRIGYHVSVHMVRRSVSTSTRTTGTTRALLDKYGALPAKSVVVPNGVPDMFFEPMSLSEIKDFRATRDEFVVGYVGVLREWVDFEPLFLAARRLRERKKIRIVIVGDEGGREKLEKMAKRNGIESQVSFVKTVPHDKIREYIAGFDCGIIPFSAGPTTQLAMPLKLFEYISMGKPVISTRIGAVVENFGGEAVVYESEAELEQAIKWLIENPDDASARAKIARSKVERNFTWSAILSNFDKMIDETVQG